MTWHGMAVLESHTRDQAENKDISTHAFYKHRDRGTGTCKAHIETWDRKLKKFGTYKAQV